MPARTRSTAPSACSAATMPVVNGTRTRIYPGVVELLERLRGHGLPIAVVTNKAEAFTLPLLERMAMAPTSTPWSVATPCRSRTRPGDVHIACARLGVPAGQALMVGDSANDAFAARDAGMPVLLVRYGYSEGMPVDSIECDGLLSSALEVLDHIGPA